MSEFNWDKITSKIFIIDRIENRVNAVILFVEKKDIDFQPRFRIVSRI